MSTVLYYERRFDAIKKIAQEIRDTEDEKAKVYKQRMEINKKFNDLTARLVVLKRELTEEALRS